MFISDLKNNQVQASPFRSLEGEKITVFLSVTSPQPRGPVIVLMRPCSIFWLWLVTWICGPHSCPAAVPIC